ncbi:MAG: deoxyribonuclease IV [Calditrichaeota bacterium]|nr:deoxyribonuclease IV [Calditrichota bacterium]RQV99082.1 MAG: deoxyribonuclease IV [Calditrichota bacterium]
MKAKSTPVIQGNVSQKAAPQLGAHTSTSGGLWNAVYSGKEIGCDVIQLFSKNQMQWMAAEILPESIERFLRAVEDTGVQPVAVHDAYLINLGSPNPVTFEKSYSSFVDELKRCEALKIPYLIMHPGAHLGSGEEGGMNRIAGGIARAFDEAGIIKTAVLLETTAGQGSNLGYTFEQLKYIMDLTGLEKYIGICLDTCHVFTAGYDIRTEKAWQHTRREFDSIIGLEHLKVFHLNDSKKGMGSRVDRHERIGRGEIGLEGFRALVNDPEVRHIPMILEIPGGEIAYGEDLRKLRKLIGSDASIKKAP